VTPSARSDPAGFAGSLQPRKVARADEWGGLESRCGLRVTVGSNPTPSAEDPGQVPHFHGLVSFRSSVVKPLDRRTTDVPQLPGGNGQVRPNPATQAPSGERVVIRSEQRVQIFSIGPPKEGTPRDKRRYRVRWRVDGQDKTRSLKTKAEAERLQAQLQVAVIEGEKFDLATGLTVSWVERDTTWWEWSREWVSVKWSQWAGHSRRSAVESLVALTPLMSRHRAPYAPDNVATWLREHGYRPGSASQENVPSWLSHVVGPAVQD
jgi:hypothetical protein